MERSAWSVKDIALSSDGASLLRDNSQGPAMTEGATAGRSAKWWRALFRPWSRRMVMAAVLAVASCGGVVLAFVAEAGLERGRNLSGQVTDANDGTPVVAATVEVDGELGPNGAVIGGMAHTDDQGRFELRVCSGDRWIRVRSDGYATKTIRIPERNREAIVVALDTGGTIAGRLVLPTGGPATGDVTLVASRKDPLRPLGFWEVHQLLRGGRKATVGESGDFRLENVPPGRYKLMATSKSGTVRDRLVEVYEGETNPSIQLVVKPLATITGSLSGLIDDERATLRVETSSDGQTTATLPGVANGPFEISGIPNGEFVLVAQSSNRRVLESAFEISNLESARVDLAFMWSSRLWGRVRTATATGPWRMEVVATPQDQAMPAGASWTAPDGSYEIAGLGDGNYNVVARGQRFEAEVAGDTELDLTLSSNSLAGTVWAMGEALGGRVVVARAAESDGPGPLVVHAETGLDAKFRFDGLPAGQYAVAVMDPFYDGAVRHIYVNSQIEGFDFQLDPTDDLRSISVGKSQHTPQRTLQVDIRRGVFDRLSILVELNADGVGRLPLSLRGADLRVSLGHAHANIPQWNGDDLIVNLIAEKNDL